MRCVCAYICIEYCVKGTRAGFWECPGRLEDREDCLWEEDTVFSVYTVVIFEFFNYMHFVKEMSLEK